MIQLFKDFANGLIGIALLACAILVCAGVGWLVVNFPIPSFAIGAFMFCCLLGMFYRTVAGVVFWK